MSSRSSSQAPSQPPPGPQASTRNAAEEELRRMMREGSPMADYRVSRLSQPSSRESTPEAGAAGSDIDLEQPPSSGPLRTRNEQRAARRLSDQLALKPYQRQAVDEFVTSSTLMQSIKLFAQSCAVQNTLDRIIHEQPLYVVSVPLKVNIQSLSTAVLLSSKLGAYKGNIPKQCVLACLLRDRLHIPSTYDHDTYVSNTIDICIGTVLTQIRSDIKKAVRDSIKYKQTNFDLATRLVKDTKCTVTVPLCGKIAILRKIYSTNKESDFWDLVDERLALIRTSAENDPVNFDVTQIIKGYLITDREEYGSNHSDSLAPEQLNAWQQGVDEVLEGNAAT